MTRVTTIFATLSLALTSGCGGRAPEKAPFSIHLSATTDDGEPLSLVAFETNGKKIGKTTESGGFMVQLRGAEGATLPIAAQCPEGYVSPPPGTLRLAEVNNLSGEPQPLSFEAVCVRNVREVVVVVHAENGEELPITVDGEVAGRTDAHGNAHVLVPVDREVKSLAVSLDTRERPRLRPQNPRRVFELEGKDAVALFQQPFSEAKTSHPLRGVSRAPRHIPYRVK